MESQLTLRSYSAKEQQGVLIGSILPLTARGYFGAFLPRTARGCGEPTLPRRASVLPISFSVYGYVSVAVCLSVCLSLSLSLSLSISRSLARSLSLALVFLFLCLSICLPPLSIFIGLFSIDIIYWWVAGGLFDTKQQGGAGTYPPGSIY